MMRPHARLLVAAWVVLFALTMLTIVVLCALPAGGEQSSCRREINAISGSVNDVVDYLNASPRFVSPAQLEKAPRCSR